MRSVNFAASLLSLAASTLAQSPAAIYNGGYNSTNGSIALRIGNGGAGQSGLIGALANAFIKESISNGSSPFRIAWYTSDTTESINYLKSDTIDIGITYNPAAEAIAIEQGIAKSPAYYDWRDHFLLVGPPANPANLSTHDDDIFTMLSKIFSKAATDTSTTEVPTRFLTRYDKSATNIKESLLWVEIGQVPWATAYSKWYHEYIAYPIQALTAAILLGEYTLTDRGTYLSINQTLANQTVIYKAATDNATDPLLNPAHILIGASATNGAMAENFTQWAISEHGQNVISTFEKNGQVLYSVAPENKTAQY